MNETTLLILLDISILVMAVSMYKAGYYSGKRAAYLEMLAEFKMIDKIVEKEKARKTAKNGK